MKRHGYIASLPRKPKTFTPEQRDFLERRTQPFLDNIGIDKPLCFLLQEAYLQGMRDAMEVTCPNESHHPKPSLSGPMDFDSLLS